MAATPAGSATEKTTPSTNRSNDSASTSNTDGSSTLHPFLNQKLVDTGKYYCPFLNRGFCRESGGCNFSHDTNESIRIPTNFCHFYLANKCLYGQDCKFIHGEPITADLVDDTDQSVLGIANLSLIDCNHDAVADDHHYDHQYDQQYIYSDFVDPNMVNQDSDPEPNVPKNSYLTGDTFLNQASSGRALCKAVTSPDTSQVPLDRLICPLSSSTSHHDNNNTNTVVNKQTASQSPSSSTTNTATTSNVSINFVSVRALVAPAAASAGGSGDNGTRSKAMASSKVHSKAISDANKSSTTSSSTAAGATINKAWQGGRLLASLKGESSGTNNSNPAAQLKALPLCPYSVASGQCPYAEGACKYLHGQICDLCIMPCLHPYDEAQRRQHRDDCLREHEREMELSFAVQRSKDKICGICMDTICEKKPITSSRFGILEKCNHIFCLDCIRKWRGTKQFESKTIRACPECRVNSDFVVPSKYWIEDEEDKGKLICDYKAALR